MPPSGSTVYSDYIAAALAREDERKASIEARGLAVVTTAGALATLLLGLAALTAKSHDPKGTFVLPDSSQGWLKWALISFVVAAVGAIATNMPVWILYAEPEGLQALLTDSWSDPGDKAEEMISENRILILKNLIFWNKVKGWVLFAAMFFEVVAIGCIARAVWLAF